MDDKELLRRRRNIERLRERSLVTNIYAYLMMAPWGSAIIATVVLVPGLAYIHARTHQLGPQLIIAFGAVAVALVPVLVKVKLHQTQGEMWQRYASGETARKAQEQLDAELRGGA